MTVFSLFLLLLVASTSTHGAWLTLPLSATSILPGGPCTVDSGLTWNCDWSKIWNGSLPGSSDAVKFASVLGLVTNINLNISTAASVAFIDLTGIDSLTIQESASLSLSTNLSVIQGAVVQVWGSLTTALTKVEGQLNVYAGAAVETAIQASADAKVAVGNEAAQAKATLKITADSLIQGTLTLYQNSHLWVSNAAHLVLQKVVQALGNVTVDASATLEVSASAGQYNQGASSVLTLNGAIVAAALLNSGLVQGNGVINGSVTNSGVFSPGASPGTLYVSGDYTQTDTGTYKFELASPSNYDRIIVSGHLKRAGILNASLLGGYVPKTNDKFQILTHASSEGKYTIVRGDMDASYFNFQAIYDDKSTTVQYTGAASKNSAAVMLTVVSLFALLFL